MTISCLPKQSLTSVPGWPTPTRLPINLNKRDKRTCIVNRCNNRRCKGNKLCPKHKRARAKEVNPIGYTFDALKQNAKRRGHNFELTLEQFKEFCKSTGYMDGKGRRSESLSIDRIDPNLGYSIQNIQVLSLGENCRKRYVDYYQGEEEYYQNLDQQSPTSKTVGAQNGADLKSTKELEEAPF